MKKLFNMWSVRLILLVLLVSYAAAPIEARTTTYSGKVSGSYPITVILEFDNKNHITGKFAYDFVLEKEGDVPSSWFDITTTEFRYGAGVVATREWFCEVRNSAGKIIEYWNITDNPEHSSNLEVKVTNNVGKEYRITLKPMKKKKNKEKKK